MYKDTFCLLLWCRWWWWR